MFDVWRWRLSGAFPVEFVGPEVLLLLPFPCFVLVTTFIYDELRIMFENFYSERVVTDMVSSSQVVGDQVTRTRWAVMHEFRS